MGKILVGVDNLDTAICQASGKVYADGSLILTPGAKDELGKRGIAIVYGPRPESMDCGTQNGSAACPPGCTCPACIVRAAGKEGATMESLVLSVTEILKNQYHITDPEQLKTISLHVLKTIRENI